MRVNRDAVLIVRILKRSPAINTHKAANTHKIHPIYYLKCFLFVCTDVVQSDELNTGQKKVIFLAGHSCSR